MQTMPISSYHIVFYKFHKAHIVMIFIMACFWSVIVASNKNKTLTEFPFQKACNLSYRTIEQIHSNVQVAVCYTAIGLIADILKITKSSSIHNIAIYLHLGGFFKPNFKEIRLCSYSY